MLMYTVRSFSAVSARAGLLRLSLVASLAMFALPGCGESSVSPPEPEAKSPATPSSSSPPSPEAPPLAGQQATPDAGVPAADFYLLTTRLLPSSPPEAGWLGVTRIDQASDAKSALSWQTAIPRVNPLLRDPSGLAFRKESAEVFIGNRYGNSGPGSISRFTYSAATSALADNGKVEHPSLSAVVQVSFNPVSGDLFAASFLLNQVARFTFSAQGAATFAGVYKAGGGVVGAICSPSGKTLYVTTRTRQIDQFDVSTGKLLRSTTASADNLHLMAIVDDHLFVAGGNAVTRFKFAGADREDLVEDGAMSAPKAIAVSFSPDGKVMFVAEHGGNQIGTFTVRSDAKVADPLGALVAPPDLEGGLLTAMGMVTFPKAATPVK